MRIIFSGVKNERWRSSVLVEQAKGKAVAWQDAESMLLSGDDSDVYLSGVVVVWLYGSPIDAALGAEGCTPDAVEAGLDSWLRLNRAALNLKGHLGKRLVFVDGRSVDIPAISEVLAGDRQEFRGPIPAEEAVAPVEVALLTLLGSCDSRFVEVCEFLDAASLSGSGRLADAIQTVPISAQLLGAVDSVRQARSAVLDREALESRLRECRALLEREKEDGAAVLLAASRKASDLEAELVALRERQASFREEALKYEERLKRAGQGSEMLRVQLRQAQEESERCKLRLAEAEPGKEGADKALGDANREIDALKFQLRGVQAELQDWAARAPDLSVVASRTLLSTVARRLARKVLPASFLRRRADRHASPGPGPVGELEHALGQIRQSSWFDAEWYLATYQDVKQAGVDAAEHYHVHGWKEGRKPGPDFDSAHYLAAYPDVRQADIDPLLHFIRHGAGEGRQPTGTSSAV